MTFTSRCLDRLQVIFRAHVETTIMQNRLPAVPAAHGECVHGVEVVGF